MYKLWCEWDFGQGDYIFVSEKAAFDWLKADANFQEMLKDDDSTFEDYHDEGLLGTDFLEIIE